jgi:hypothetical protein
MGEAATPTEKIGGGSDKKAWPPRLSQKQRFSRHGTSLAIVAPDREVEDISAANYGTTRSR